MQDLQRMAQSGVMEDITPTPVLDGKPLTMEKYLNLPASKKLKCRNETVEILPASIASKPMPTAPTGNASPVLDGGLVTLQQYARLSKTKRKRCVRDTSAIWPAETVSLLTTIPDTKMVLRVPAKPLLEECQVEPTKGQTSDADASIPMSTENDKQGLVFNDKYLSWREYIRLRKKYKYCAMEGTIEFLRDRNDAAEVIKNILQEAVDLITFRKFDQNGTDKDVKNAVKAWWKVFVEFEEYQKNILGSPEHRINGLIYNGKSLSWAVYMAFRKRDRNLVLDRTWSFHFSDPPNAIFPRRHMRPAEMMWNVRQEAEKYILHLRANYDNVEEVVAKTWKAWRWITGKFRKRAEKRAADVFQNYQRKPGVNPATIVKPDAILWRY
jgi:hypothetical protein